MRRQTPAARSRDQDVDRSQVLSRLYHRALDGVHRNSRAWSGEVSGLFLQRLEMTEVKSEGPQAER